MEKETPIIWKPIDFKVSLFAAAFNDSTESCYWINEFKNNKVLAFNVAGNDLDLNIVVRGEGNTLVVCLLVGNGLMNAIKTISERAKSKGFSCVRYHVNSRAKARMFDYAIKKQNLQAQLLESIYKVVI